MRILVVSDTHGHENNLERVLKKIRKPDHLEPGQLPQM